MDGATLFAACGRQRGCGIPWRIWAWQGRSVVRDHGSMISCFSKTGKLGLCHLHGGWHCTRSESVHAVVYALAKEYCVEDTNMLVWTMDKEVAPDTSTFNSPIGPLCKVLRGQEAMGMFDAVMKGNVSFDKHLSCAA